MTQDPRLPWLTIGSDGLSPAARSRSSRSPSSSTSLAAPSSGFGSQHFLQRHQRSRASVYSSRPSSGYGSFHSVDVESTRRPKSAPVRSGDGISTLRRLTRPRTGFLVSGTAFRVSFIKIYRLCRDFRGLGPRFKIIR